MSLVPLSVLKSKINPGTMAGREHDDTLVMYEEEAVDLLSQLSGWKLTGSGSATDTDYYNGTGTYTLPLRGVPASSPTLVVYERTDDTWSAVATTEYEIVTESSGLRSKLLKYIDTWTPGELNHKVVCTRGYTEETCPALLRAAVVALVEKAFRERKVATPTVLADQSAQAIDSDALPQAVKQWLEAAGARPEAAVMRPLQRC